MPICRAPDLSQRLHERVPCRTQRFCGRQKPATNISFACLYKPISAAVPMELHPGQYTFAPCLSSSSEIDLQVSALRSGIVPLIQNREAVPIFIRQPLLFTNGSQKIPCIVSGAVIPDHPINAIDKDITGNHGIPGKILFGEVSGGSVNALFEIPTYCISRLPLHIVAFSSDKAPASSSPLHRSNRPSFLSLYGTA